MRERERERSVPHLQVGFRVLVIGLWSVHLKLVITCYCARISWLLNSFSTLTMFLKLKNCYQSAQISTQIKGLLPEHSNHYAHIDTARNSRYNLRFELFVYFSQILLLPMCAKSIENDILRQKILQKNWLHPFTYQSIVMKKQTAYRSLSCPKLNVKIYPKCDQCNQT